MNEDGSMKVLRKGSGAWTWVPDDPSTPGNDPMCLTLTQWNGCTPMRPSQPRPTRSGLSACFKEGGTSNTDPFATKPEAGKATITGPHVMVVGPRMKSVPGYDRTGEGVDTTIPYVMWKDTQYEHLMIPIH